MPSKGVKLDDEISERLERVMRGAAYCGHQWSADQLASRLGVTHHGIAKALRQLKAQGRVEGRRDWEDNIVYWTWKT